MQKCKKAKIEKHVESANNARRTKVDKNAKSGRIAIEVKSAKMPRLQKMERTQKLRKKCKERKECKDCIECRNAMK